jgi:hypothetical protein
VDLALCLPDFQDMMQDAMAEHDVEAVVSVGQLEDAALL